MINKYITSDFKFTSLFSEKYRTIINTPQLSSEQQISDYFNIIFIDSCKEFENMIKIWHLENEKRIEKIFLVNLKEEEILSYYEKTHAIHYGIFFYSILNFRLCWELNDFTYEQYFKQIEISYTDFGVNIMSNISAVDYYENQAKEHQEPSRLFHTYNDIKLTLKSNDDQRLVSGIENEHRFPDFTNRITPYLKDKAQVPIHIHNEKKPKITPAINGSSTNNLTKKHIALICHYNENPITRDNALRIANEYGHDNAGRLYQEFCVYQSQTDRLSTGELSTKKLNNKLKLFECVIEHLSGKAKFKAQMDLNIIISKTEK